MLHNNHFIPSPSAVEKMLEMMLHVK